MWENFGGGKFWRTNGSKVFGEEKFGESVGTLLKTLTFINIGGENFGKLPNVRQIRQNFCLQNFPTYGIIYYGFLATMIEKSNEHLYDNLLIEKKSQ